MRQHYQQTGGALQNRPWDENNAPWMRDGRDDALQGVYEANIPHILQIHDRGPVRSVYNFPLDNDVNVNQLTDFATEIYNREQQAFRLNLVFGVILQHRDTDQYRYFVPYNNNGIFERPIYISRRSDLNHLRNRLRRMDITTELLRIRPDTKWIPVLVTNVNFTVFSTHYPLGQGQLPGYLLNKYSIYPLVKNQQTSEVYDDNLCAFRCLALHQGYDIKSLENPAKQLFRQWCQEPWQTFEGLSFEDFPEFETRYRVNVEVYSLDEEGFARSIYKSMRKQESTMYLNMYENHLSFIKDFAMYAQKYRCKTCDRHFDHAGHLHRHQKVCSSQTKYVYPGGFHKPRHSIFDRLSDFGIDVPEKERTFPWFICYDFEAILQRVDDQPTQMLQWTQQHVPISVSICSNVEGHTDPVCIVNADQDTLVSDMVSTMTTIADRVHELADEKWGWVLQEIDEILRKSKEIHGEVEIAGDDEIDEVDEIDGEDGLDGDVVSEDGREKKKFSHPLLKIYGQMETYMSRVPTISFNGSRYDLNLIKRSLAKHLNMHDQPHTFVVKKNNAYTCISNEQLKFLDMSQFLAAGSSYAGFLKAYKVEEKKGFFPYEWFDDASKLEYNSLPAHQDFYSHLKSSNISLEDYQYCQKIWTDNNMSTFRDFLIWYNNLDVGPFVTAIERFQKFYFDIQVDIFQNAISLPGVSRQLLFRTAREQNVNFALFDESNKDLYHTIKQNIVGGPSIIFTRHHCAGKTLIRGQKPCQSILGFDANALYLQAIGQPMPVGPFVRRLADNDFRCVCTLMMINK